MRYLLILVFATSAFAADLPKYWSVHIDTLRSEDRDDYEQAGREQAVVRRQILTDHNIDRPAIFAIRTHDGTYLSFRPRENFAAFDATLPAEVREEIRQKAGTMDDRVHASLRDHHSEIWETMQDLTVIPENAARARGFGRLATIRVKPASFDDFNAVMKRFAEALRKTHPQDVVLTFFSTYGDGAFRQLWTSDEEIVGMRDAFKEAFGEEAADGLMKQWRSAVLSIHVAPARPRPDLTATTPETWLQY
jgi:hypothetical protein